MGTFGLSLSKASAQQHNRDVEHLLESLSEGRSTLSERNSLSLQLQ